MTVKDFKQIIKDEDLKDTDQINIRVSTVDENDKYSFKVVPAENYYNTKAGFQIGCYVGE